MIRAYRAEGYKLRRRGVLIGSFGLMVGLALLITVILFATAKPQQQIIDEAIANAGQPSREGPGISIEALEKGDGFALPFQFAGSIFGVVALVLFAQNMGNEYGQGTLKVALSQEPRRVQFLAGKVAALSTLIVAAVLVAFIVQVLAAFVMAEARGIDTTDWWTRQAMLDAGALALRVAAASMVWGCMGLLLATVLRAAPPAIGIGIGYTLLAEPILALALKEATKWMPGRALTSFLGWGSTAVQPEEVLLPGATAAAMVAIYAIAFAGASAALLWRRDVTS